MKNEQQICQAMLDRLNGHKEKQNGMRLGFLHFLFDPLLEDRDLVNIEFFKQGKFKDQEILEMFNVCPEIRIDPYKGYFEVHPVKVVLLDIVSDCIHHDKNHILAIVDSVQSDLFMKLVLKKLPLKIRRFESALAAA